MVSGVVLHGLSLVRAHNLVILAGLAANGFAAYLMAWRFTRRAMPSVVAGTSFATCAYLSVHLLGHVNLTHAWVLPVFCLAWVALVEEPGPLQAIGVALASAAAAYTDYYYAIYAGLFAVAWSAVTLRDPVVLWARPRPARVARVLAVAAIAFGLVAVVIRLSSGITFGVGPIRISALHARNPMAIAGICALLWAVIHLRIAAPVSPGAVRLNLIKAATLAAVLTIAAVFPILLAAFHLMASGDYTSQQYYWRSGPRGVDVATFVLGPPMHGLTGHLTTAVLQDMGIDRIEQTGWLGVVATGLLCLAMLSMGRLGRDGRRWMWMAVIFLVWSMGSSLTIAGQDTGILLPEALARYVPIVSNARMPGRAFVMFQLAACVLGAAALTVRSVSSRTCALLAAIVVIESAPLPFPTYSLPAPDRVDAVLRVARNAVVVELPTGVRDGFGEWGRFDHRALVHQMAHEQRLVGGFTARLQPSLTAAYRDQSAFKVLFDWSEGAQNRDYLPADLGARLRAAGVGYVVVEQDAFSSMRPALELRGLRFMVSDGGRELYRVD
jgi:hypothetical protein